MTNGTPAGRNTNQSRFDKLRVSILRDEAFKALPKDLADRIRDMFGSEDNDVRWATMTVFNTYRRALDHKHYNDLSDEAKWALIDGLLSPELSERRDTWLTYYPDDVWVVVEHPVKEPAVSKPAKVKKPKGAAKLLPPLPARPPADTASAEVIDITKAMDTKPPARRRAPLKAKDA